MPYSWILSTLHFEYAPLNLGEYKIVIANTNKKEGPWGFKIQRKKKPVRGSLKKAACGGGCGYSWRPYGREFETYKDAIKDETLTRRARHAVYENQRTIDAVEP